MELAPRWITAFLDLPEAEHDRGSAFWAAVTGCAPSAPRGDDGEFSTLEPDDGDAFLRVQRVGDGAPRIHLDLHVADPRAAAAAALARGAREVADLGYVVMASPGGLPFCFVDHPASRRPAARRWDGGHASLVDQVCLDVAHSRYDDELAFWAATTGWEVSDTGARPEFRRVGAPADQPFQLLVQRRDDDDGPTSAHLDLGTSPDGRAPEVARHEELGARVREVFDGWTVMRDPVGAAYCVTTHLVR